MLLVNVLLGTAVVAVGFWLLWGAGAVAVVATALLVASFLTWKTNTVTEIWAWSTLLLGLESFAWPVLLMVQFRSTSTTPSEEEIGTVLSAVVLGLFASVFWISFAYGLFKRARKPGAADAPTGSSPAQTSASSGQPKRRR